MTPTQRRAMEMAHEALETELRGYFGPSPRLTVVIEAIRAALAEQADDKADMTIKLPPMPAQVGSTAQLGPMLDDALAAYWDAAYAEGCEQRTHDTENGAAQTALLQVRVAVAAMVAAERERCAQFAKDWLTRGRSPLGMSLAAAMLEQPNTEGQRAP